MALWEPAAWCNGPGKLRANGCSVKCQPPQTLAWAQPWQKAPGVARGPPSPVEHHRGAAAGAQPLPTLPFWLLLTHPKAEQHQEPEPQPRPQRQHRWGGRKAHHLPVAPGLGGEGNRVRGTEPEESSTLHRVSLLPACCHHQNP